MQERLCCIWIRRSLVLLPFENSRDEVLWDFELQTDEHLLANQADIEMFDKKYNSAEHQRNTREVLLRLELVKVVIGLISKFVPEMFEAYESSLTQHSS